MKNILIIMILSLSMSFISCSKDSSEYSLKEDITNVETRTQKALEILRDNQYYNKDLDCIIWFTNFSDESLSQPEKDKGESHIILCNTKGTLINPYYGEIIDHSFHMGLFHGYILEGAGPYSGGVYLEIINKDLLIGDKQLKGNWNRIK